MIVSWRKYLIFLLLLGMLVVGVGILVRATMGPESYTPRAAKKKRPNAPKPSPQPAESSVATDIAGTATEAAGERKGPPGARLLRKPDEVSDEWFAELVAWKGSEEAALRYLEGIGYGHSPSALQTEEGRRAGTRKREEKIQTARQDILIARLEGAELEEYLRCYVEYGHPRVKRGEILTAEFLAELAAERARAKQAQLDNIERLKVSPVLLRFEPLPTADPRDPFLLQQSVLRRVTIPLIISRWPPLDPEVQAALMAAFRHRLGSLSPFNAARDTVLGHLMNGVATHCGAEGSRLLKESFYGCTDEKVRIRLLDAYTETLPPIERADFLAYVMRNDPSEQVRMEARGAFRRMLIEGRLLRKEENRAISEKYAAEKRELVKELLRKGDERALSTLMPSLDACIEPDRTILQWLARSGPTAEVRDEAMEILRQYEENEKLSEDDDVE